MSKIRLVISVLLLAVASLHAQATHDFRLDERSYPVMVKDHFPGVCGYAELLIRSDQTIGQNLYECGNNNDWNLLAGGGGTSLHSITIPISGSPIVTGSTSVAQPPLPAVNYSCTINKATISGNASGSIAVAIWKANGRTPTSGDLISASAPVSLSSAQYNFSAALTGWTTAVSINDVFWASVTSVDGSLTGATVQIWCQ